ncbi:hypothetical protein N2152v2_001694 [Parachlorella kessleri]
MFCSITDSPRGVAEHVLDAHHWDLNNAVAFYLESGGVGHGNHGPANAGGWDAGAAFVQEPEEGLVRQPAPAGAAAFPRSQPIEIADDDDDDLRVLASNFPASHRPPSRHMEDAPPVIDNGDSEVQLVGSLDEEFAVGPAGAAGARARRQRRNRPSGAGSVDRDLQMLGQRFGVMDDEDDDFGLQPSRLGRSTQPQQQQQEPQRQQPPSRPYFPLHHHRSRSLEEDGGRRRSGRGSGGGGGGSGGGVRSRGGSVEEGLDLLGGVQLRPQQQQSQGQVDVDIPGDINVDIPMDLPDDVDLEEQRMLLAALTGGAYEGQLPDFGNDPRYRARALSPGAQERQTLRQEQDAAYYESLQADMEREAAEERARHEAEQAERAAREAEQAEQRRQQEDADRQGPTLGWLSLAGCCCIGLAELRLIERTLNSKQAALPPEPANDGGDGVVNVLIRLPGGSRIGRRFRKSDLLQSLFDFVDVQRLEGLKPHTYHLVMQYPRKTFEEHSALTLLDAGLSAKQEALYLEMKQ